MKILAFDTTMQACSAAAVDTSRADSQAFVFEALDKGHAEALVPMIQGVMSESGIEFDQLDRIIVTLGPGAFTGVRIGLSTARGIVLGIDGKIQGVTSLEAMAVTAIGEDEERLFRDHSQFAVCADARRGEVYIQLFDEKGAPLLEAQALTPQDAALLLDEKTRLIVGNGGELVKAELPSERSELVLALPDLKPKAQFMLQLADRTSDLSAAPSPVYLRAPDAKPQSKKLVARAEG